LTEENVSSSFKNSPNVVTRPRNKKSLKSSLPKLNQILGYQPQSYEKMKQ
jgi:hypothetical protein